MKNSDQIALVRACVMGHAAVVARLLQDERIDPSLNHNEAIREGP